MRPSLYSSDSAGFWIPPPISFDTLARMRAAIWPKLGLPDLPWGPRGPRDGRPGRPDNIAMIDGIEMYSLADQRTMCDAYIRCPRRYTHTTMGPIVDPGYHGLVPACDWRTDFNVYLDAAERWERFYDVHVCHFLRPDQGVAGLTWDVEDCERELTPLFTRPRAQALMRFVCLAWEPGGRYGYNNDWWVRMCDWMARTFPHALRAVHLPVDQDAPVGPADDGHPNLFGWSWGNIAPFIHMYFVQNGGYANAPSPVIDPNFLVEFKKQFDVKVDYSYYARFQHGARGGITYSADWQGQHPYGLTGIVAIPFEYWASNGFWLNYPSAAAHTISDAGLEAGAIGFCDDGGYAGLEEE